MCKVSQIWVVGLSQTINKKHAQNVSKSDPVEHIDTCLIFPHLDRTLQGASEAREALNCPHRIGRFNCKVLPPESTVTDSAVAAPTTHQVNDSRSCRQSAPFPPVLSSICCVGQDVRLCAVEPVHRMPSGEASKGFYWTTQLHSQDTDIWECFQSFNSNLFCMQKLASSARPVAVHSNRPRAFTSARCVTVRAAPKVRAEHMSVLLTGVTGVTTVECAQHESWYQGMQI